MRSIASSRSAEWRTVFRANLNFVKKFGSALTPEQRSHLKALSRDFGLRLVGAELRLIDGNWYVTHAGLMRLAMRNRCCGIDVRPVVSFCDAAASRWAFKATVYTSRNCKGFVGYGDADPSNVSPLVHGAELRIAETRAVNRALRKAYGIGICSMERSVLLPRQRSLTDKRVSSRRNRLTETVAVPKSAIAFAKSFASTNLIPTW